MGTEVPGSDGDALQAAGSQENEGTYVEAFADSGIGARLGINCDVQRAAADVAQRVPIDP